MLVYVIIKVFECVVVEGKMDKKCRNAIFQASYPIFVNIQKTVFTENEEGQKLKVLRASSDNEEGQKIANSIFEIRNRHQAMNSDFAILYRTNA